MKNMRDNAGKLIREVDKIMETWRQYFEATTVRGGENIEKGNNGATSKTALITGELNAAMRKPRY